MRTPQEAIADILAHIEPLTDTEHVPLAAARGRVLAEDVVSDVDLPPFEKAMMDGIAVRAADTAEGPWDLELVGEARLTGRLRRKQAHRSAVVAAKGRCAPPEPQTRGSR